MVTIEEKIIGVLQEELPICQRPFQVMAQRINMTEAELVAKIKELQQNGRLRKVGAVLKHREIGFHANALCAWQVSAGRLQEVGKFLAQQEQITHCYARKSLPEWPYNLYTMLHAANREECRRLAGQFADQVKVCEYILLFSTHEWKKSSMRYV